MIEKMDKSALFFPTDIQTFFDVLLTVHLNIFILVINHLDAQNFCSTVSLFHASTCFEHHVLIIRRPKVCYTASGIITPIGGRPVRRLREASLNLRTGRPPTGVMIPDAVYTILTS
jgi:hypothetical protein